MAERPSTPLLVMLAGSMLLAGWMYGKPLITGSDEPEEEEFLEPTDLGFVDDGPPVETEPWEPPETGRDPFEPVDLTPLDGDGDPADDGAAGATEDGADGPADDGDGVVESGVEADDGDGAVESGVEPEAEPVE